MLDQIGVRAARGFEGVGQKRHAVESALDIDAICKSPQTRRKSVFQVKAARDAGHAAKKCAATTAVSARL